ncbi:MAG: hypothetical protein ABJE10_09650 [bacterium]
MTARISRPILFALGATMMFVAPLRAQEVALVAPAPALVAPPAPVAPQAASIPSGPTLDAASVAVKNVTVETKTPAPTPGKYYDQGTKLMLVGGAAILTGIVVGGDAGHAISIAGAVIGLYGLYKYLE